MCSDSPGVAGVARTLLKDELAFGKTLVIGVVSSRLDEIQGELEQLAGMQRLFETWVEG